MIEKSRVARISDQRKIKTLECFPQAYIARISTQEFLDLTTNSEILEMIKETSENYYGHLSVEQIKDKPGSAMYLRIDFKSRRVTSHEGRHRIFALQKEGFSKIDIFIFIDNLPQDVPQDAIIEMMVKGEHEVNKKHIIKMLRIGKAGSARRHKIEGFFFGGENFRYHHPEKRKNYEERS